MSSRHRRQWPARTRQKALLEFASLKYTCPAGIYVSLTPGNPSAWSGVFFTRNGPYVPAILRFEVSFPDEFPHVPPLITFKSDIFHPLVTPLTTYAYTTGSSGSDAGNTLDQERLPPGGFSLRSAFPNWFGQSMPGVGTPPSERFFSNSIEGHSELDCDSDEHEVVNQTQKPTAAYDSHPVASNPPTLSLRRGVPTMADILGYLKSSFEDEELLDNLPLESAVCPGAWHAWVAYRGNSEQELPMVKQDNVPLGHACQNHKAVSIPKAARSASHWNWDGVWVKRVRTGVDASISGPVLFANDSDDPIRFLDIDENERLSIREQFINVKHG